MFLVAKEHLRDTVRQLRVGSFVYALEAPKTPALQFRDLDRVRWEMDMEYDDDETEEGFVARRDGTTILDGQMFLKGKFVDPPIHLVIDWAFIYDSKENDYRWGARLGKESSHVLVDDRGKPLEWIKTGDWLMLRRALGKDIFKSPPTPSRRE